jgi:hypothetical protein
MSNPIAFNPDTMSISQVKRCVETLRTCFELLDRDAEAGHIKVYLEQTRDQMLKLWGEPK